MESEDGAQPRPDNPWLLVIGGGGGGANYERSSPGLPPGQSGPHISHFVISLPPSLKDEPVKSEYGGAFEDKLTSTSNDCYDLDEDGDLIRTRRSKLPRDHFVVTIRHNITSSIPKVGLQVWRA